jgi:hypothetical protein
MYKYTPTQTAKYFVLVALMAGVVLPNPTFASTTTYQPQTQLELISYLQGVLDTLIIQLNAQRNNASGVSSKVTTDSAVVEIQARTELRASFEVDRNSTVYAWFQYGLGSNLDRETSRTRIRTSGTTAEHSRVISNLEPGETYTYRAVFETKNGREYYGEFKTFTTGGVAGLSEGEIGSVGGSVGIVGSGRYGITTNASSYKTNEMITINWSLPANKADNDNWIGMFEVGKSNSNSHQFRDIENATSGTFKISSYIPETYEFRMFLARGSDDYVATSRRITIRK